MPETTHRVRVLILRFKNKLRHDELPYLRGAINEILKENNNVLFHNHDGDSFRYSYPLIQYKRINQQASMVCLNEGTEAIGLLLMHGDFQCRIGNQEIFLEIDNVKANQNIVQVWTTNFTYRLRKWLPLNQENYLEYNKLEGIGEKCLFLEKVLIGNFLSLGKGLKVHFETEIACKIILIEEPRLIKYKNIKMMAFDIEFKSNVSVPDYVGLGKGASLGFGMVVRKNEQKSINIE